jgi:hypothetical protein
MLENTSHWVAIAILFRNVHILSFDELYWWRLSITFGKKDRGCRKQREESAAQIAPMQTVDEDIKVGATEGSGLTPSGEGCQVIHHGAGHGNTEGHAGIAHNGQQTGGDAPELCRCAAHDSAVDRALEHAGPESANHQA